MRLETLQEFEAVHARHHEIGHQDVDRRLAQLFERFLAVRRGLHGITPGLDHLGQPGALIFLIIGD